MTLPTQVLVNCWAEDGPAAGNLDANASKWGARPGLPGPQQPLFAAPADPTQWKSPRVGYAVLLPDTDDPTLSAPDKAAGADAPEPILTLLQERPGTVVVRWRSEPASEHFLRRYYPDGSSEDRLIGMTPFGVAKGCLPKYLLMVADPTQIPWSVQYELNVRHAVGRLPLSGQPLVHYVNALLNGWDQSPAPSFSSPVVWASERNAGDITAVMRQLITDPLVAKLTDPRLPNLTYLKGPTAGSDLLMAISDRQPALIVSSSHGQTLPLNDLNALRAGLGLPVDHTGTSVPVTELVATVPAGTVWYSHACCSAGADGISHYTGLLKPDSSALRVLNGVAALGPTVAPYAVALLGRENPIRAVIGHVEPTFDWTLQVGPTGAPLTGELVDALSDNLLSGQPVGYAFAGYRNGIGMLNTQWAADRELLAGGDTSIRERLTRVRLTAIDQQSMVLLGDPTVTVPGS